MSLRLGKQEHVPDPRTMMLGNFMAPRVLPARHDFDAKRAKFPLSAWGNDAWGNCVKVGQANQLIRFERLESRRTLKLTEELVVEAYKDEVERQFQERPAFPGGSGDNGLYVIDNLRNWRKIGWDLDFTKKPNDTRTYTISAFGELDPYDYEQQKAAIYLLHGVQYGFWLPLGVAGNLDTWDYDPERNTGEEWAAGSWGGHLVYSKAYDGDEIEVITWGVPVRVTKRFIAKYCDEAWGIVDSFNAWRKSKEVDTEGMLNYLREIGATGIE